MEIKAGTYKAKINTYGMSVTKNDDMQIAILFDFDQDGETKQLSWFGTLKEGKGIEITMKSLKIMGYDGNPQWYVLGKGPASQMLDMDKEYFIKVELETYENKTIPKIKWINDSENNVAVKFLNFEEVVGRSKYMKNVGNEIKNFFRKDSPIQTKKVKEQDDFDIPF